MKRDTRLSTTLHVLLHLADAPDGLTSETLAGQTSINAAALRRTLGGLRDAGLVHAQKGHGGGWALARGLGDITLGEVYDALGMPALFALGNRNESPRCLLEQAVNRSMAAALGEAEALLVARLGEVTLADIAADVPPHTSHRRDP